MARETIPEIVELGNRLKDLRKALHISQKDFAASIDVSASFLSEVEAGKTKPGFDFFYNISKNFNVNMAFLLHGTGTMFREKPREPSLGDKKIGEQIETPEELMWYIENSRLFMHTMLGFATKFLYDNENIIKKDIQLTQSGKEKKDE
ncbi:MAG: helix-turn-helix domain-containing protein [Candidatus Aminicenantes bacterium]|nr:helix-turn-helix domain-containing protein [Candidatus Aminicenantes bacterium]NIM83945.1 helix-turn-helix domain-containing protein [Candidatus Aminicenantes bacterium]NIN23414.1 helix-turn-helix domain-containing protein [Candidatus Aminicenantes bacterium]NIN47118.1 helix-turn-helix domain-containing protein [Candidatus Aminicenantes bacterium]NIN90042.1 helix-turn-helix domain-containing protein [Candidatus Aminicenantes bacterium]